ncbi:hypothetical protein B0H11DRAFT_2203533, partial [Mycena galericulata]
MPKGSPDKHGDYRNVRFTSDEDRRLVAFIAAHDSPVVSRISKRLYAPLGPTALDSYAWSRHRTSESWRIRYKNNWPSFDLNIKQYKARQSESLAKNRPSENLHPKSRSPARELASSESLIRSFTTKDLALMDLKSRLAAERIASASRAASSSIHYRGELAHPSYPAMNHAIAALSRSSRPGSSDSSLDHAANAKSTAASAMRTIQPDGMRPATPVILPVTPQPPAVHVAAHAHAKVHRKLSRMARRTKTASVDRAWAVYSETGDIELTRQILEAEAAANADTLAARAST